MCADQTSPLPLSFKLVPSMMTENRASGQEETGERGKGEGMVSGAIETRGAKLAAKLVPGLSDPDLTVLEFETRAIRWLT